MKTVNGIPITIRPHNGLLQNQTDYWHVYIDNYRWSLNDAISLLSSGGNFDTFKIDNENKEKLLFTCRVYSEAYKWFAVSDANFQKYVKTRITFREYYRH